jgi:phosphoserine phosphatase
MNNKLAVFDFDKTIIYRDSLPYFIYFSNKFMYLIYKSIIFIPYFIMFKLSFIANSEAKEKLLSLFYKGISKDNFELYGYNFCSKYFN